MRNTYKYFVAFTFKIPQNDNMYESLDDVIELSGIDYDNKKLFGEELASLGELSNAKIKFSPSFLVTPQAFELFRKENNLDTKIKHLIGTLNPDRHDSITQVLKYIQTQIRTSAFPNTFVSKIFRKLEFIEKKERKLELTLTALFTHNGITQKKLIFSEITGESELLTTIRDIWSYTFSHKLISNADLLKENLSSYPIIIFIEQKMKPRIQGYIRTVGDRNEKNLFIIEAIDQVRFSYNKSRNKIESGHHINSNWQDLISIHDLNKLIEIAKIAEKKLYYPHIIYWGKENEIFLTGIKPVTQQIDYYSKRQ